MQLAGCWHSTRVYDFLAVNYLIFRSAPLSFPCILVSNEEIDYGRRLGFVLANRRSKETEARWFVHQRVLARPGSYRSDVRSTEMESSEALRDAYNSKPLSAGVAIISITP